MLNCQVTIFDESTKLLSQTMSHPSIHPKSEKIGGDYLSAQKNWRKKCENLDDKILRQNWKEFLGFFLYHSVEF